jgi:hypothetical protein
MLEEFGSIPVPVLFRRTPLGGQGCFVGSGFVFLESFYLDDPPTGIIRDPGDFFEASCWTIDEDLKPLPRPEYPDDQVNVDLVDLDLEVLPLSGFQGPSVGRAGLQSNFPGLADLERTEVQQAILSSSPDGKREEKPKDGARQAQR